MNEEEFKFIDYGYGMVFPVNGDWVCTTHLEASIQSFQESTGEKPINDNLPMHDDFITSIAFCGLKCCGWDKARLYKEKGKYLEEVVLDLFDYKKGLIKAIAIPYLFYFLGGSLREVAKKRSELNLN